MEKNSCTFLDIVTEKISTRGTDNDQQGFLLQKLKFMAFGVGDGDSFGIEQGDSEMHKFFKPLCI